MKLQTGLDDFGKVRSKRLNFVDKTIFIKDVLDNDNIEVSVITRPRRFGKTFNLSMLQHFLTPKVNQLTTKGMFNGLKISTVDNSSYYMQYQGKFPVVFVSFKEIKSDSYELTYSKLCDLIFDIFNEHDYLRESTKLTIGDKQILQRILDKKIERSESEGSLRFLTSILFKHYGIKPWLLIDEYDTPIQAGYLKGYYNKIVGLMRGMFGAALKTNPSLDRAVITGILRVSKESLFSDLNNITVCSLLQPQYSQHFGFTEEEVHELLVEARMEDKENEVKDWYNGYVFGGTTVYNPWSIVNYINNQVFKLYWVNTSGNDLIRDLLVESSPEFKEQFKLLLQDKTLEKVIDEHMVFGSLKKSPQAIWSLLLMSGYLKSVSTTIDMGNIICNCAIPNLEVKVLYRNIIKEWLGNGSGIIWYQNFLLDLLNGNVGRFTENFGQVLAQTVSVYDVAHNPEAFYHGFMLGLAAGLDQNQYELKSNRESGGGRYDIAIIPKDISKPAIILEIKSISPPKVSGQKSSENSDDILMKEAQKALEQINRNQYAIEIVQRGIANIVKIGLAFSGKKFQVASEGGKRKK